MGAAASISESDRGSSGVEQHPRRRSTLIIASEQSQRSAPCLVSAPPSLTALQGIVLQAVCFQKLRGYALNWRPKAPSISSGDDDDDDYFLREGNTIALNCIDFVSEATDFALIPQCGFQYYRACHIFEKFLMSGAACLVPLSRGLHEECSAILYGGKSDESGCSPGLFEAAVAEALDFLLAEVCPSFENDIDLPSLGKQLCTDISTSLSPTAVVDAAVKAQLTAALGDSACFDAAVSFAARTADAVLEGLLRAHTAVQNTSQVLSGLQEGGGADELSMVAFLHHLHRLYKGHLLPGNGDAPALQLASATKGDFLLRVAKCVSASADVLLPLQIDVQQQLGALLLSAGFLQSSEFLDSKVSLDSTLPPPGSSSTASLPGEHHEHDDDTALCDEIMFFLGTPHAVTFAQYMHVLHNELPLIHFCQSVLRYQQMASSPADVLAESTDIFERYLSKNAMEQVKMPEAVIRDITRRMFKPDSLLFAEGLHIVLVYMSQRNWPAFKQDLLMLIRTGRDGKLKFAFPMLCSEEGLGISSTVKLSKQEQEPELGVERENDVVSPDRARSGRVHVARKSSLIERTDGKKYTDSISFEDIMNQSQCLTIFKAFLDTEGTAQTLLFLIEVDEFIKIPEIGFQQNRAKKIFFKYIHSKAILAVPIAPDTLAAIEKEFQAEEISPLIFNKATVEVKNFVANNQFPRFMKSDEGSKVRSIIQAEEDAAAGTTTTTEDVYVPNMRKLRRQPSSMGTYETKALEDMTDFHQLMKHPTAIRFFKDYCVRSHCNENLFFWLDAEDYAKLPGSDFRKRVGTKLYRKYITQDSPMQINISGKARERIESLLEGPSAGRLVFVEAQEEVFELMKGGTFPAFLSSKEYEQLGHYFQASASTSA